MPAPKGNKYAANAAKRKKEQAAKQEKVEKKMGAPKFQIDYETVKNLATIMCTQAEIATILGCSESTLSKDEDFRKIYKEGQENGKMSLRRAQFKAALKGNTTMLVWLGKQFLGQSDRAEITTFDGDLMVDDKFDEAAQVAYEEYLDVDDLIEEDSLVKEVQ